VELHFSGVLAVAVKRIVKNWKPKAFRMGRVYSKLMGSARDRLEMYSRYSIFNRDTAPVRSPHFPVNFIMDLVRAILYIKPEWKGDCPPVPKFFRECPL
jgi:hypothetical protein